MGFFLTVLLIWGAMHVYVWVRVCAYVALNPHRALLLGIAMAALMVCPFAGMMVNRAGHAALGKLVTTVGMVWGGAFVLFVCVSLVHDLYNGLLSLAGLAIPSVRSARLLGPYPILGAVGLVVLLSAYSVLEASRILTEHVRIETAKLAPDVPRVRIVQVTDLHLGLSTGRGRLRRALDLVRRAEPDLLVSTGDLVDGEMTDQEQLSDLLGRQEAPLGKYAVTGNHEYYAGLAQALAFTRRAGFTVLQNESVRICPGLTVVGFDDETARRRGGEGAWDEGDVLRRASQGDFILVLKHRPLVRASSVPLMDLQLSGHTHRGQLFSLIVEAHYEHGHGLVELEKGRYLYTSRGTGTWGPPMRLLSPPEVTVIDIVRKAGPQ